TTALSTGHKITIETDGQGVPRITGKCPEDVAFGLGFVHGRDRFFQMDLARRFAAGELAELLGGGTSILESDRSVRRHRFRRLCQSVISELNETDSKVLESYTAGVNHGLTTLKSMPWEYSLLKSSPRPWLAEDSMLVSHSIYLFLEGGDLAFHQANAIIHEVLPPELAAFLTPTGGPWDAPVEGEAMTMPPIPSAEAVNLRQFPPDYASECTENWTRLETKALGSNAWAVSGPRAHGGKPGPALLADDMHLGFGLPPTWYKVTLITLGCLSNEKSEVHGVSLPGGPAVVAGSNRHIAWGLTSAQGDWGDLLTLELDPGNPRRYKTPEGWQEIETITENIKIKDRPSESVSIDWTIWGPVVDEDLSGRRRVWRWVAQEREGSNLNIAKIAKCHSVNEALATAPTCGLPHVNFLVADAAGQIGWTIMGRIPRRNGEGLIDERLPMPAAATESHWNGYLNPEEYPTILNPEEGLIWSANHRMVSGEKLRKIGRGRYDRGVRASRIRNLLREEKKFNEFSMLAIQMDHEALLLQKWRNLMLSELTENAIAFHKRWKVHGLLSRWNGKADAESTAYPFLNECRLRITLEIMKPLVEPIRLAEKHRKKPQFHLKSISLENTVWALLQARPIHLLSPKYNSWSDLILDCIDQTIENASDKGWPAWGEVNRIRISHPFANKMKWLRPWLSSHEMRASGSLTDMPGIASAAFGASQRMVVFPGREKTGIMQLPGGQSGHPASPFYLNLLEDWIGSRPTPLKAGPAEFKFTIEGIG
ncbi:MAG: penicillin acylase family protein, partial [bacterium]